MCDDSLAIVLISNGPGELGTWVKPLSEELHSKLRMQPRSKTSNISLRLVLVPCPNATGNEQSAASKWGQFEIIIKAKHFWNLLLKPNKYSYWPKKGVVIFLGGDQFWSVLLSARLGYLNITYAEWIARWPFWSDLILAMSEKVLKKLSRDMRKRCEVVGDLMGDLNDFAKNKQPLPKGKWIALMPGSKQAKLRVGVPFLLDVADELSKIMPECNFLIPIAPTTNINEILYFGSKSNQISKDYNAQIKSIEESNNIANMITLKTYKNTTIYLKESYPAHNELSQCTLAITTVGANTAELGALTIPMIIIVPTQHLNVMQAWDGLLGIVARLPVLKWCFGILITFWKIKLRGFLAWPNIKAGKMIVPERVGNLSPNEIAKEAAEWLKSPNKINAIKTDLELIKSKPGAIKKTGEEIIKLLKVRKII